MKNTFPLILPLKNIFPYEITKRNENQENQPNENQENTNIYF